MLAGSELSGSECLGKLSTTSFTVMLLNGSLVPGRSASRDESLILGAIPIVLHFYAVAGGRVG